MTDQLDRLHAANPITDLDAVARGVRPLVLTPPREPQRRRRVARGPRFALAAVALAAVAVAAGVPGVPGTGSGGARVDVAAAAVAALDPGNSILHVVSRTTESGPGASGRRDSTVELWLAPGGREGRQRVTAADGKVLADMPMKWMSDDADGSFDPITLIRRLIKSGQLAPAGQTTIDGREAQSFKLTATRADGGGTADTTLYFDADVSRPLKSVSHDPTDRGEVTTTTDYLTFDRLPDTPENRRDLVSPKAAGTP